MALGDFIVKVFIYAFIFLFEMSQQTKLNEGPAEWKLFLQTADVPNAETDSEVYIELIGTKGFSNLTILPTTKEQLQRGHTDLFVLGDIDDSDFGDLKYLVITKKKPYSQENDWMLEKAKVYLFEHFSNFFSISLLLFCLYLSC